MTNAHSEVSRDPIRAPQGGLDIYSVSPGGQWGPMEFQVLLN